MFGKRLIHILTEAVFPSRCLICDAFIEHRGDRRIGIMKRNRYFPIESIDNLKSKADTNASQFTIYFHRLLADLVCPTCLARFTPLHSPLCTNCGLVFQSESNDDHQCDICIKTPKRFGMARAFGIYDQTLMELIHCFKYRGKIQLAYAFGVMLLLTFLRFWSEDEVDLIIPVPLHKKRFRNRGFNQAYLMIMEWKEVVFGNDSFESLPVERDVLIRKWWTDPQTGLGRKERIKNIKDAFEVSESTKIYHKHILLVDDVYTTGATANECSKALLAAGAKQVDVLTLARAL